MPFSARADQVFRDGVELNYVYDFGSTTRLKVRHVDERRGTGTSDRLVTLMARNEPPELPCQECGEPAVGICMQCVYEKELDGTLCAAHAREHPHEDYGGPLPVVNSPRMGVCGYTGPPDAVAAETNLRAG